MVGGLGCINDGNRCIADIAGDSSKDANGPYGVIPKATKAIHKSINHQTSPRQRSSGQKNKNAPKTKQHRHEQSEVPTPTKTLTHGGCLTGAPKARREFRRGYSKAIFDYFLAQQKVIAQVGGSPDTGKKTQSKYQKNAKKPKTKSIKATNPKHAYKQAEPSTPPKAEAKSQATKQPAELH